MIVVFSHDAFFQRYGGVSRCVVELMRRLERQGQLWRTFAGRYGSRFLQEVDNSYPGAVTGTWSADAPGRIAAALRNEPSFGRSVAAMHNVVVHRSYYPFIDRLPARVPVVVTLHDMYWEAPGTSRSLRHRLHGWLKHKALRRADRIVCISHFTQDELIRTWPDLAAKAEVIHHGVSSLAAPSEPRAAVRDRFVFVGDRSPRKNFVAALSGLAASELDGHDLLCVGGGAFTPAEQALIKRHGLSGRVLQAAADDAALARHYETAAALLYTSTYEGFGMPLLEAMLHYCPVIAARASSLPEVGGDAVLYADPHRPHEWAAAMREVTRPAVRERMLTDGRGRAAEFSWEEAARRYAAVYRAIASRG